MKRKIYAAVILAALALAFALAYSRGLSGEISFGGNCRYLSDGFFAVGMVILSIGGLMWVATTGFFDMMTYSVRFGLHALLGFFAPERRKPRQDFYDYKVERETARKKGRAWPLLAIGGAMVALAAVFLVLYYRI
ncbi:MAG: DUF3899 domain-containing protein [Clostridia bacterium]|nr:DUF3899 domain-containing protein [Clostridia bacterium]